MFLRNAWYVAARSHEIGETPLARTLLNEPVVLYRASDGTPVALEDRCCHRHVPLSIGTREGDALRCGYHGLLFGRDGACLEVPGQNRVPPGAQVRTYPLIERFDWVWIWMGDPDAADPTALPGWDFTDAPDWKRSKPHLLEVACDYRLISDNVLDVTHLAFVHINSIGSPAILEFPHKTEREDGLVRLTRWILDRPPPPMYQAAGGFNGNVDRGQIVEFVPPCHSVNHAICTEAGEGLTMDETTRKLHLVAMSAPTPETETTTHYFFTFARGFGLDDPSLDKVLDESFVDVFKEDVVVLEAQQRRMTQRPDAHQIDINVDAAPIAARNMLAQLIEAEQAGGRTHRPD